MFPDLDHFDRRNYVFNFVRWEVLGEVRCGVVDVTPRENLPNRGFVGRIWIEDQDFNIVRFTGSYTAKQFSKRSFHFDSWRLDTGYHVDACLCLYRRGRSTRFLKPRPLVQGANSGVGLRPAGGWDHHENTKPLTDNPAGVDPNRHETSQDLSPSLTLGKTTYTPEDEVVERLQVGGLMAPDGEVDRSWRPSSTIF